MQHQQRRRIPAAQGELPRDRSDRRLSQFWQRRCYDFNVWSQRKNVEKIAHMHTNPVKRGLVAHPKDWPWSSYAFYAERGDILARIDPVD